ncbi:hypothetical protein NP493_203g02000 [Ridgeia piscesae]|uniref:DZANK-type domain-containing protein n=1 Tax=Ridgeia piscesae TaxID=27915 RepID=A0AAD9P1A8_RIDPI|nr:hypothetical protein NP493_203g02000 [Ridgeia piscesae]
MDGRDVRRCRGVLQGNECGASLRKHYKFCPECGFLVDPNIWTEDSVCTRCGWKIPSGLIARFCPECGNNMGAAIKDTHAETTVTTEIASGDVIENKSSSSISKPSQPPGNEEGESVKDPSEGASFSGKESSEHGKDVGRSVQDGDHSDTHLEVSQQINIFKHIFESNFILL